MITTAMINGKTARVFRQVWSPSKDCRESCNFCSGMGLTNSRVALPGATKLVSCNFWSMRDLQSLEFEMEANQSFLVPGKYLMGEGFLKVLQTIPRDSRLILVLDRENFDLPIVDRIRDQFETEIWVVPTRSQKTESLLQRIYELKKGFVKTYLYSPTYSFEKSQFYTTTELYKILKRVKKIFPQWACESPPGLDLHNPTLDQGDLIFDHEILFNSTVKGSYKVSVIIPSFENTDYVIRVLSGLARQTEEQHHFEVIVVDDGSRPKERDRLLTHVKQAGIPLHLKLIYYKRSSQREMGDNKFRAGLARTLGVSHANAEVYAFLDSDILVPPNYIEHLIIAHKDYDVVQVQRLYLTKEATERIDHFEEIDLEKDIFHPEQSYWKKFFDDPRPWQEMSSFWKYVCTYGLSVRSSQFRDVNGFRSVFNSYGFEDTDLGFRLAKNGARFLKSPLVTYHLWHAPFRSEFGNSELMRNQLLQKTGRIFFRHALEPEVFEELGVLLGERRPFTERLRSLSPF